MERRGTQKKLAGTQWSNFAAVSYRERPYAADVALFIISLEIACCSSCQRDPLNMPGMGLRLLLELVLWLGCGSTTLNCAPGAAEFGSPRIRGTRSLQTLKVVPRNSPAELAVYPAPRYLSFLVFALTIFSMLLITLCRQVALSFSASADALRYHL